jgi:ABC-type sulfate/molybdate transport systems ATPase subunit
VLVGPSGCGKSTLLNMIAGLEADHLGRHRHQRPLVAGLPPSKRDIAMVFQSYALYPNMTVAGNIAFGMEIRGVPKEERDKAIKQVSDMLQIGHLLDRKPSQLSGGQRQRVAMGRALVRNPQVFLFDEPLSNLDAKLRVDMRTEIKQLHARMKTTIVYVTHDQIEAMTLATKIAVLNQGHVQQLGTPKEIYDTPANVYVATFMGSPAMNGGSGLRLCHQHGKGGCLRSRDGKAYRAMTAPDVIIIGSGIGGATLAATLAPTGKRILILERGDHLTPSAQDRSDAAIFADGFFRPDEEWLDGTGKPFNPGNYYYVGGNSKFYGAVLIRYRREDFLPPGPYRRHHARLAAVL